MAFQRKQHRNGTGRGGNSPQASYTAHGSPVNMNKSPKRYQRRTDMPPPIGAHLLKRT